LCPRGFLHPGTLFVEEADLDNTRKAILYHIDKMNIIRIGPSLFKKIEFPNDHDNKAASLNVNDLQTIVGEKFKIELKSTFLGFFLDASKVCLGCVQVFEIREAREYHDPHQPDHGAEAYDKKHRGFSK